jgi:cytochrome P450
VNSNTYKLCFWVLSYLLYNVKFLHAIREETRPAFLGDQVEMTHLLEDCPCLNAVFDEVMRLTNSSSSIRRVASEVRIGGFKLREGTNVLIPYRQLHFNEGVFGSDVWVFNPDRFLKNKSLNRNVSYRPFGGGSTYCPGRFIARQEVVAFIAIALYRYDITLA